MVVLLLFHQPVLSPTSEQNGVQVALQRKMFEQYEKRERQRKVAELQDVVPGLTAEEADKALDFCGGRCTKWMCRVRSWYT